MPKFTYMLDDRVHVRLVDAAEKSEGGTLFIPETAKQSRQKAEVLCVGPKALGIEVGMVVELQSYAGENVGDDTLVVRAPDILGIWED
jgi:co-chaperonin GroES (HSP10)